MRAHFVLLTLLLFCSVFRVLAVCSCASICAAAGDDFLRSCHKPNRKHVAALHNPQIQQTWERGGGGSVAEACIHSAVAEAHPHSAVYNSLQVQGTGWHPMLNAG